MIDKIDRLDQTVNDALIIMKSASKEIIETIDDAKDYGAITVDDVEKFLQKAEYINKWANKLALLLLQTERMYK